MPANIFSAAVGKPRATSRVLTRQKAVSSTWRRRGSWASSPISRLRGRAESTAGQGRAEEGPGSETEIQC